MAKVKIALRFPTKGHKRGDVIEVEKEQGDALVANGSARPVKAAEPKPDKG